MKIKMKTSKIKCMSILQGPSECAIFSRSNIFKDFLVDKTQNSSLINAYKIKFSNEKAQPYKVVFYSQQQSKNEKWKNSK